MEVDRSSYLPLGAGARNRPADKQEMLDLVRQKPRYGYRRLWALLVKREHNINPKRVYRWYREEGSPCGD